MTPRPASTAAHNPHRLELLSDRIGQRFDGIVTGASKKGTWVRISRPVEGKLVHGFEGLDGGDHVHIKLIHTDVTTASSISPEYPEHGVTIAESNDEQGQ